MASELELDLFAIHVVIGATTLALMPIYLRHRKMERLSERLDQRQKMVDLERRIEMAKGSGTI